MYVSSSTSKYTQPQLMETGVSTVLTTKQNQYCGQVDLKYRPIRDICATNVNIKSRLTSVFTDNKGKISDLTQLHNLSEDFLKTIDEVGKQKLASRTYKKLFSYSAPLSLVYPPKSKKIYSNQVLKNIKRLYDTTDDALLMVRRSLLDYLKNDPTQLKALTQFEVEQLIDMSETMIDINQSAYTFSVKLKACLQDRLSQNNTLYQTDLAERIRKSVRDAECYLSSMEIKAARLSQLSDELKSLNSSELHRAHASKEHIDRVWQSFLDATQSATPHDPSSQALFKRHYSKGLHTMRELSAQEVSECKALIGISDDEACAMREDRHTQRQYLSKIQTEAQKNENNIYPQTQPGAVRKEGQYTFSEEFRTHIRNILNKGELILMEHTLSTFPDGVKFLDMLDQLKTHPILIATHPQLISFMDHFYDTQGFGMIPVTPKYLKQAFKDKFGVMLFPGGTPSANCLSGEKESIEKALVTANRGLRSIWHAIQSGMKEVTLVSVKDPVFKDRKSWGPLDKIRQLLIKNNIPATYLRASGDVGWGHKAYRRLRKSEDEALPNISHQHLMMKYPLPELTLESRAALPDKPTVLDFLLKIIDHSEDRVRKDLLPQLSTKLLIDLEAYYQKLPSEHIPELTKINPNKVSAKSIKALIASDNFEPLIPLNIRAQAAELTSALKAFERSRLEIPGAMVYLYEKLSMQDSIDKVTD